MFASLLFSIVALLGDASNYRNLGFSPDGRYFAFLQSGVQDGSGISYADIGVIEVATNRFVAKKVVSLGDGSENFYSEEQAIRQAFLEVNLAQFNIVPGRITGVDLWSHPAGDRGASTRAVFTFGAASAPYGFRDPPTYEVLLQQKSALGTAEGRRCAPMFDWFGGSPMMFRLSIVGREGTSRRSQVLQDDTALPRSRSCPSDYAIRRVTTYRDAIVVVLEFARPGFEGADWRFLVVTGRIAFRE